MAEGARDGLCVLSPTQVILKCNRMAGEILGFSREDVLDRTAEGVSRHSGFDWSITREVATRRVSVTVIQNLHDGRKLMVSGAPVFSGTDDLLYVVLTVRDITGMGQVMTRLQETTRLSEQYRRALRARDLREPHVEEIVTQSATMRSLREQALQYAVTDSPVLLLGETGTGKGVFARLIHQASAFSTGPFLEVNCGAIPDGLMEAELFGYARGAFTGADSRGKVGLVDLADKGTLLLNEIGDMPVPLQVKLLRLLEDGEVWAVGSRKPKRPEVRIIAATNRNLGEMIGQGTFRGDLFYRLNVLTIPIPPLREHPEDIPQLVELMLSRLGRKLGRRQRIAPAALSLLSGYPFPGNVRELWNLLERLAVTTQTETIGVKDIPPEVLRPVAFAPGFAAGEGANGGQMLRKAIERVELEMLKEALARYRTQALAANYLGITQSTVARKVKQYGLRGSPVGS